MGNYFNTLNDYEKRKQLNICRFMNNDEFSDGVSSLFEKKIVIVGCGAQGLNQGLNMRDSGLDISYVLRQSSIDSKKQSFINAIENDFIVGNFEELIPDADLVINLTPDKNHTSVVNQVVPLMKKNSVLSYSHGFNIVEEGAIIRDDITVIMVAPKCPGTEVREEFLRGFGVPTLIAVHPENDPNNNGLEIAKSYAVATGGHRAGVLESSFVAEVKSDLMGEQTILCGVLQTGSLLCFNKMLSNEMDPSYSVKLIQYGWETITEELKHNGITGMINRLDNESRYAVHNISNELKEIMTPLFNKHMNDILDGTFSSEMMKDWDNDDKNLLKWREETGKTLFEETDESSKVISNQEFFDHGILMIAFVKSGVELAFETMVKNGIIDESAYYESLHELPLIANLVARKKLYEMNRIISDTAEYGCYLFNHKCLPLLSEYVNKLSRGFIGEPLKKTEKFDIALLKNLDEISSNHPIEKIGKILRKNMSNMKKLK
jgi:ketol-acid reductoisomerase